MKLKHLLFIVSFLASLASLAQPPQSISCRGDLTVYGIQGKNKAKVLNQNMKGFQSSISEFSVFVIGLKADKPFVEVRPWGGIHIKNDPKAYREAFLIEAKSDGKNFFSVKITGKTSKYSESIACEIF